MRIYAEDIQLVTAPAEEDVFSQVSDEFDLLKNLSELHTYGEGMPQQITFRIEKDGQLAGAVALQQIRWYNRKALISIMLKREYQGQKIARKALHALLHHAFKVMNFHRLEAEIFGYNKAGIALVEKLGFIREGILREARYFDGQYHDIIRFGLLKDEFDQE